ncbi:C39 family peptidase [Nocardioides dubius]|uniref:Peptidase C39 family protein n=1 Tax=Nocardioides dubius TaxID=317019 RepID=A0ABP4EH60_9ACTN
MLGAGALSTALLTTGALGLPAGAAAPSASAPNASAPGVAARKSTPHLQLTRWSTPKTLSTGRLRGTAFVDGTLRLTKPVGSTVVRDPFGKAAPTRYDYGSWTSPWRKTGFAAQSLVPSWSARAPRGTLLRISVRVASGTTVGSWDTVADWDFAITGVNRYSGDAQRDDLARLATDTVLANAGRSFDRWQVRVHLMRKSGTKVTPRLRSVSGIAADYTTKSQPTSATTMSGNASLPLTPLSQMTHAGHYPQWGGGGEAWCSPTSVSMVMQHLGLGPTAKQLAWTHRGDGRVDHAARHSYDFRYRGTGNWAFSAAYAGAYGADAYVTRLADLRAAEAKIRAGIPVVVSIRFARGQLSGAPISSTNGHLLVISGFTSTGRVIVHDPAGATNAAVRRTYDRAQFERAWLGGSGGIAYLITR